MSVTENTIIRISTALIGTVTSVLMTVTPLPTHKVDAGPAHFNNLITRSQQPEKLHGSLSTVQITEVAQYTHPKVSPPQVTASSGNDIELIVRQAARKYGIDEEHFVRVAKCESGLNPDSVNHGYYENGNPSGLYQHISGYWPARAAKYGWSGASVFNPQANAEVTAGMFRDGQQRLWECK